MADITRPDNLPTQEAPKTVFQLVLHLAGEIEPIIVNQNDVLGTGKGEEINTDMARKILERYPDASYFSRREVVRESLEEGKVPYSVAITYNYFINPLMGSENEIEAAASMSHVTTIDIPVRGVGDKVEYVPYRTPDHSNRKRDRVFYVAPEAEHVGHVAPPSQPPKHFFRRTH